MLTVHNLATMEERVFDTNDPIHAVKLAVLYDRGITGLVEAHVLVGKDVWPYDKITQGKRTIACGDWCCLLG